MRPHPVNDVLFILCIGLKSKSEGGNPSILRDPAITQAFPALSFQGERDPGFAVSPMKEEGVRKRDRSPSIGALLSKQVEQEYCTVC